jgi:hypothetical protein
MISALVAVLLAATAPTDTVFTVDGGRISGTVLEESPTAGVTLQLPDGTVRRIERSEVARIEFADGTVSTPRATQPPPVAAPAASAAAPAAKPVVEGPIDTVYFVGGGRVRGTVMEESAATGVKVRRLDGSVQIYSIEEAVRIEYADGTVSTPRPAPAKPAVQAPAPQSKAAEAPIDTVFFFGGGRVRGTVIEENPKTGVRVRLLDGSIQTYSREDLVRIEYADGSISRRKQPAPAAPPPAATPAPPAAVPAAPKKDEKPQLAPLYLSLGIGATFLGGDAARGVPMNAVVQTSQAHVSGELGLRLTPAFAVGAYGDVGASDPAASYRDTCSAAGLDCTGTTGRAGVLFRYTWSPLSSRPTWMSLGTGWEFGGVTGNSAVTSDRHDVTVAKYTGREYVRLGVGVDFRSNQIIGLGLYGSVAFGEYDDFKDPTLASAASIERATHTTAQLGLRLTLFP